MLAARRVVDPDVMTLRRPKKGESAPLKSTKVYYEMREDLRGYVNAVKEAEEAEEENSGFKARTQSQIIDDAVEQDMVLDKRLSPHVERMEWYADAQGLTLRANLPEVLARLVELGLDSWEKRSKK